MEPTLSLYVSGFIFGFIKKKKNVVQKIRPVIIYNKKKNYVNLIKIGSYLTGLNYFKKVKKILILCIKMNNMKSKAHTCIIKKKKIFMKLLQLLGASMRSRI